MYVVFLHGPAASGKHTIASRISELTGLPLFHNHLAVDVAKSLFPFGSASFNYLRATIWLSAFAEAAKTSQSFIFTFNSEATVNPALIEEMCAYVSAVGGKVHFVQLICSRETVLSRIANPSRARFGKLIDPVAFESIEASGGFNFPDLPTPVLVVDTEKNTPEEAASLIVRALGALQT